MATKTVTLNMTSEDAIQIALFNWIRKKALTDDRYKVAFHCPNGGNRSRREGARFKLMGVTPGIPDVCIPVPNRDYHGLYLELKTAKGRVSPVQKDVMAQLTANGYYTAVCRSFEEGVEIIEKYERNEV